MQKKQIFWAVLIVALIGCYYFESQPEYNSETINKRELNAPEYPTQKTYPEPAAIIKK